MTSLTLLDAVVALSFLVAGALQYNDPDPAAWIALYVAAAAASVLWPKTWLPAGAVGAVALAWALFIASRIVREHALGNPFHSMQRPDDPVELTREMLGLLLVSGWMIALVLRARHAKA